MPSSSPSKSPQVRRKLRRASDCRPCRYKRHHELAPRSRSRSGCSANERLQPVQYLGLAPQRQIGLDVRLRCITRRSSSSRRISDLGERLVGEVGQRRPRHKPRPAAGRRPSRLGLVFRSEWARRHRCSKRVASQVVAVQSPDVSGTLGAHSTIVPRHSAASALRSLEHVNLQRLGTTGGWPVGPQLFEDPIRLPHLVGVDQQARRARLSVLVLRARGGGHRPTPATVPRCGTAWALRAGQWFQSMDR